MDYMHVNGILWIKLVAAGKCHGWVSLFWVILLKTFVVHAIPHCLVNNAYRICQLVKCYCTQSRRLEFVIIFIYRTHSIRDKTDKTPTIPYRRCNRKTNGNHRIDDKMYPFIYFYICSLNFCHKEANIYDYNIPYVHRALSSALSYIIPCQRKRTVRLAIFLFCLSFYVAKW